MQIHATSLAALRTSTPVSNNSGLAASGARSQQEIASLDKGFQAMLAGDKSPEETLEKMTKNGISSLWSWQIEQLKAKVASQVMKEKHLSPQAIANMPDQQRAELEDQIMKEVERRVKEIVEEGVRKTMPSLQPGFEPSAVQRTKPPGEQLDLMA